MSEPTTDLPQLNPMPERQYKDVAGSPCSLEWLVRNEPDWAANQIRHRDRLEYRIKQLAAELEAAQKELATWKKREPEIFQHKALFGEVIRWNVENGFGDDLVTVSESPLKRMLETITALRADKLALEKEARNFIASGKCECNPPYLHCWRCIFRAILESENPTAPKKD